MQVVDWLAKQARLRADRVALVDLASGREVTYGELDRGATRVAGLIRRLPLLPGSRIAILSRNSVEYVEWLYGCARARVILVCLNWRLSLSDLSRVVADAAPSALVFEDEFDQIAENLAASHPFEQRLSIDRDLPTLLGRNDGPSDWGWRDEGEPWYLFYVPGPRGAPLGVIQTFGMTFLNAVNDMLAVGLGPDDVFLSTLPMCHTSGLNLFLNPLLMVGGTTLIQRQFDAGQALSALESRANLFFGIPSIYFALSQHPAFETARLRHVRTWGAGGLTMPPTALFEPWAKRGMIIRCGYGLVETGPTVFLADEKVAVAKPGTVGKPVGTAECRVVDHLGIDLGPNQRGELIIRGPGVTPGYWQNGQATANAFADGWLRTGDVAYFDEEGDFFIVDRVKNMFVSGGEAIYPAEIENVLAQIPEIAENGVIAVSDERWGEVAKAVIAVRPGQALSAEGVLEHCRRSLAGFKVPKYIQFVAALPRNATGKIDKVRLREAFGNRH